MVRIILLMKGFENASTFFSSLRIGTTTEITVEGFAPAALNVGIRRHAL